MRQGIFGKVVVLSALFVLSCRSFASDEVIATLDLKFIRETEHVAAVQCFEDPQTGTEADCFPYAYEFLWHATVRQLHSGNEAERSFLLLFGRHALLKSDISRVTFLLERLPGDSTEAPRYRAIESAWTPEIACFPEHSISKAPLSVVSQAGQRSDCFELSEDR